MASKRVRLEVEFLERREVLDASLAAPLAATAATAAAVSSSPAPVVPPTDTTTTPANSTNTVVTAQVTALGPLIGSSLSSITVSGLSAQNITATSVITLTCGADTYVVTQATSLGNGQYVLTVSAGIDPTTVQVGSSVTVTIGNGGNVAPAAPAPAAPAPTTPPPAVTPIDPTGLPAS